MNRKKNIENFESEFTIAKFKKKRAKFFQLVFKLLLTQTVILTGAYIDFNILKCKSEPHSPKLTILIFGTICYMIFIQSIVPDVDRENFKSE